MFLTYQGKLFQGSSKYAWIAGTDISTSQLALASEFLKKGLSGKYILVFTCLNG